MATDSNTEPDKRVTAWRDDLAAAHLRGRVDAPRYAQGDDFIVTAPATPLRRAPAADAPMETQLLYGEGFCVYEYPQAKTGAWAWGQSVVDNYVGYVSVKDLQSRQTTPTHIISSLRSFVFVEADKESPSLMDLSMGAQLNIVNMDDRFGELHTGGFIQRNHLAALDEFEQDPIKIAHRFINVPYLWGGRTSLGLDCSALIQLALMRCGRTCPRDSDMQAALWGNPVNSVDAPRRGDLIFWHGHVAIMSADNMLLHASATHKKVVEEDFATACARIAKTEGAMVAIGRLAV